MKNSEVNACADRDSYFDWKFTGKILGYLSIVLSIVIGVYFPPLCWKFQCKKFAIAVIVMSGEFAICFCIKVFTFIFSIIFMFEENLFEENNNVKISQSIQCHIFNILQIFHISIESAWTLFDAILQHASYRIRSHCANSVHIQLAFCCYCSRCTWNKHMENQLLSICAVFANWKMNVVWGNNILTVRLFFLAKQHVNCDVCLYFVAVASLIASVIWIFGIYLVSSG